MRSYALLFLAAVTAWLPVQFLPLGGDSSFQQIYIDCFAGQFWQGDLFPHWCMEANTGLGVPMFYPPLSYYIAALIYPVTWLGFSLYDVLSIGVLLSTIAAGITCYLWLKESVTPKYALLAAILFLFLPYNAEVRVFRVAYAEGWAIAIMPMLFLCVQRLVRGDQTAVYKLVLWASLGVLCNLPAMMVAIIICGLYVMMVGELRAEIMKKIAYCGFSTALATSFYLIPTTYYKQFTHAYLIKVHTDKIMPYANNFLDMSFVSYPQLALGIVVTPFLIGVLTWLLWRRRDALKAQQLYTSYKNWVLIGFLCLFLLLPISAPFYALFGPLEQIAFPWRMQLGEMFALVWLVAVWMQHGITKTQKLGDYCGGLMLVVLVYCLGIGVAENNEDAKLQLQSRIIYNPEYRALWTDEHYTDRRYMLQRPANMPLSERVSIIRGAGKIEVKEWSWRAIRFSVSMTEPGRMLLQHNYFPLWRASASGVDIPIIPEAHTGWMLLNVPAGNYEITLRNSVFSPL
jgi:hypothetical protein